MIRVGLNVVPGTTIIPFSAQSKQGKEEILQVIEELALNQEEE